ncbi:condensation domain-containing protein [Streptomyces sp. BE133]|uniref:condensation domain-containing protein n=1 Tax=Streptomyces sp. BE133 TaxID=3002523 RepID=UPI002E780D0F|nr:condensation domain-containing protein [Streptomyces sp. BE133]MEE1808150.1 condensation domain-containing protein [Streptomyces sp. BE133]
MRDRLDLVVAEWARRTPDATAVLRDGIGIGYAGLVERAEVVATALRHEGIGSGDVVAVASDRSVELVVALLGCLRADATTIVLDPAWPSWCTEDVLDRAAVRAVVHDDARVEVLRSCSDGSADAACLVFLPGARPHGVAVSHQELVAALTDAESLAPRFLQAAVLGSWDFTYEVWAALLNGGCVVFGPPADADHIRLSTTQFHTLAENPESLQGLRGLVVAGASPDSSAMLAVLRKNPKLRLRHVYGSAATALVSRVVRQQDIDGESLPLVPDDRIVLGEDGEVTVAAVATGDIGRADKHGMIRVLGRRDDLLRIGDRWVDPHRIETVLKAEHRIAECVVFPADDALACAYTTHDGQPRPELPGVSVHLHLPSLPAEATLRVSYSSLVEKLRTHEPDSLLAEVRSLLGVTALTPDDDLLDAGMTSLDAMRLATVLSVRGRRKVTVADIYRERRLSALADAATAAPGSVAPVVHDTRDRPLAHAQKRFLFAEAYSPGSADNLVIEAYELTGPLRPDVLRTALGDAVARHEALRTVYVWERGQPIQRVLADKAVPWTDVPPPKGRLSVREIAERITADLWDTPFRLDRELPIRARLCRLAPDRALLCLQFHHIAFDGSSELPLLEDLRHAYVARAEGRVPRFPPAPGYPLLGRQEARDLASWSADDIPYWRETLACCPPSCFPPADKGGDAEATAHETVRRLEATAVRRLEAAAARCGGPALAALSAGTAMAVARRFGVDDVCVGTLTAGRFDPAMDQLVGYLVNPFAVPLHGLRREAGTVLAAAARQVVDGLEHARTPFDEVVRELRAERGAHPWFEAWVVLQHSPPAVSFGPIALRPVRVRPPRTSRSWMVEAFPVADGGWDLVTTWRADVMTCETGAALADDVAAALAELVDA